MTRSSLELAAIEESRVVKPKTQTLASVWACVKLQELTRRWQASSPACDGACTAGHYSTHSSRRCASCPAGKMQPRTGASSCEPCTPGKHQPWAGQSSCLWCTRKGASGAKRCVPNTHEPAAHGAAAAATLVPMQGGERSAAGVSCLILVTGWPSPPSPSQVRALRATLAKAEKEAAGVAGTAVEQAVAEEVGGGGGEVAGGRGGALCAWTTAFIGTGGRLIKL